MDVNGSRLRCSPLPFLCTLAKPPAETGDPSPTSADTSSPPASEMEEVEVWVWVGVRPRWASNT